MRRGPDGLPAVLFDMDGTLVETEECWGAAMGELAARLGGRLSAQARARTVGTSMPVALGVLYADVGVRRTDEQQRGDARAIEDAVARMVARGVTWRPGARELLAAVRAAKLRTALVTTTPRRLADLVLAHVERAFGGGGGGGGRPVFDVTVCGDEVPARKPDPAPYLQALAALGVTADAAVVVEDSLAGVTAGLAAGAAVLGVPSLQPLPPLPGLVLRDSLCGIGVADLDALVAARAAA
ncbi:HAD family phosphatase [Geodermatophilus sp. TF02-6]|uniref:HAD family hydrolase n=1 Tax=Geodermatophilus sp. TF02-6 TaxID=2250575 RepID=UPI001F4289FB|nr:HAD family phosphatase [Geodermatophilus sp. TF02-6]